jgi:hypothetical protein
MINWKHCNWICLQGWSECTRNLKIIRLLVDIWPLGCHVGVILLRSSFYDYEYFRCNINDKIIIDKVCLNFFEGTSQSDGKVDHYVMTFNTRWKPESPCRISQAQDFSFVSLPTSCVAYPQRCFRWIVLAPQKMFRTVPPPEDLSRNIFKTFKTICR